MLRRVSSAIPGATEYAAACRFQVASEGFINVREQGQGKGAPRHMMRPSRKSLVQNVRKGKQGPVHEVKTARLKVLLAVGKYAYWRT
jgi:hypothetical protein